MIYSISQVQQFAWEFCVLPFKIFFYQSSPELGISEHTADNNN